MARKSFNTSIEEEIQLNFRKACAKHGLDMNVVLELFMTGYYNGEFKIEMLQENKKKRDDSK